MAGPTIGSAEIKVTFDGKGLPKDARALAKAAARGFQTEMDDAFANGFGNLGKELASDMNKNGELAGASFTDSMKKVVNQRASGIADELADAFGNSGGLDEFAKKTGGVDAALHDLQQKMVELNDTGGLTNQMFERLSLELEDWAGGARDAETANFKLAQEIRKMTAIAEEEAKAKDLATEAEKRHTSALKQAERDADRVARAVQREADAHDRAAKSTKGHSFGLDKIGNSFSRMDGTVKLVLASVLAAGGEIAALGPAIGAALGVAAAGVSALGVGVLVGIAGFKDLFGEIEDAPDEIRPVVQQFKDLGDVMGDVQKAISIATLKETDGAWKSIGDTVSALTPNLTKVGSTLGKIVTRFANAVKEGKGFNLIKDLIDDSVPVLDAMATAVGDLLLAIGSLAHKSQPMLLDFIGYLDDVFVKLEAWTQGTGFDEWQEHAETVFGAFGRLLDSLGQTLDDLVTDESVDRLANFIDTIAEFLPTLGDILTTIGKLDLFGLLADALVALGDALTPLLDPLGELFEALDRFLGIAIDEWGKDLKGAFEGLAPLVQGAADALGDMDPDAIRGIADAFLALAAGALVLKGAKGIAGLSPGLEALFASFGKGKSAAVIATGLGAALTGGIAAATKDSEGPAAFAAGKLSDSMMGALTGAVIAGPWGALAGYLIAAFVSVFSDLENTITEFTIPVFGENVGAALREAFAAFGEGDIGGGIAGYAEALGLALNNGITGIVEGANAIWTNFWTVTIPGAISAAIGWVGSLIAGFWQGIIDAFTNFGLFLLGLWDNFWINVLPAIVGTAINVIVSLFNGSLVNTILASVGTFFANFGTNWNIFWGTTVPNFLSSGAQQLVGKLANGLNQITTFVGNFFSNFGTNWNNFWSGLGTAIGNAFNGAVSVVRGAVNDIIDLMNRLVSSINTGLGKIRDITGGLVNLHIPTIPHLASGATVYGPTRALIGENGPEAVVPLRRNLALVDPSVRALSAIAQGKGGYAGAHNPVNPGKTINVQPGAIVVQSSLQPRNTAAAVIDRLVAKL